MTIPVDADFRRAYEVFGRDHEAQRAALVTKLAEPDAKPQAMGRPWRRAMTMRAAVAAAIVLAAPLARTFALSTGSDPVDVYVLPHLRADALATGAFLAWLSHRGGLPRLARLAPWIAGAGAGTAVLLAVADGTPWWWGPWTQRLGYSAFAIAAGGLVIAAVTRTPSSAWPRALSAGWLRAFGKYSYCLYLIHLPVMRVVREFVLSPEQFARLGSPWIGQLLFYVAATAPAFAIAWLSWHAFEAPILKLKERFNY